MKNIYQNLDKLEVSFCGAVPKHIRDILCAAKEEARVSENTVYVEIGEPAITVAVLKSCWGGGYRYVFDTGWDGELWGIGESDDPKLWNIRVVVRAMNLAVNGYELAKQKIYQTLEIIGAYGSNMYNAEQKTVSCELLESVARMDYCIDFDLQDFMPVADNFVAHARSKSVSNVELEETRQGNIVTGLRIGDIKRRQVAIYNKFKEIHGSLDRAFVVVLAQPVLLRRHAGGTVI